MGTGFVAIGVVFLGFAVVVEVAAGAGAVFVNGAAHLVTHLAHQGGASRRLAVGALHATAMGIDLLSEIIRHAAARTLGFTPIKRHTKIGATGATG